MNNIRLFQGNCLELMKTLPDHSVDMVLCDLPYGTTSCKWDVVIPFEPLWEQYERIVKPNGAIVLNCSQPFTSTLILSNIKNFRYCLVWEKEQATNFMQLEKQFGKSHEDIAVFYRVQPTYRPQMVSGFKPSSTGSPNNIETRSNFSGGIAKRQGATDRFPLSVLKFNRDRTGLHPTQKPVALIEYLILTYTNEGEVVLDNCMGSGSTGVACINTKRNFIGMEMNEKYFSLAKERIEGTVK
jgi:DNA modification methylase